MAGSNLSKYVKSITIDTAYLPQIFLNDPFGESPSPNPFLSALKPRITIDTGGLTKPVTVAPYGDPGASKWPLIRMVLFAAVIGTVVYIAIKKRI